MLFCAPHRRAVFLLVSVLALASCAGDPNVQRVSEPVTSLAVGDPGDVGAMALAQAMTRAGFSRAEILEMGPQIRRGLADNGGAQARRKGRIVALFSHMDGRLYVTSANVGTFTVDI
ncbi:hypothetical protein SAMN04490248_14810 [Salinihabitans flavidus]|uniref:Uncharacterized protein n=1 Tax=Salinihabitans flavidus TaxID=569882 RepID=A0A1H8W8T1_9RHOB|nr:hypothetical protein SAMN04490248_14810 [Salinihabitans flavidus]